ncbi:baseplate J/gp47 family protein [Chitinophaga nivalis]|uniref:Baseplate J/gp47 family protein n=1 Tax=Chitinophaga nivalis TaxID=2991709 RepID=A0ABT3IP36_9BACT|nr:baseplate J/gp47 family protein [Chitinophaga nivalis]MCW3464572.1 baseplate J/gp47 family protein [Chitinophaga nivalis]MCW3485737.1 baseplate J/gp47 family protein [Chitinophaga nivalis]
MSATDKISNNLVRDGISQAQRKMAALNADNLPIDGRSTAALLGFLFRYAKYVLYYDDRQPDQQDNQLLMAQGDWQDFFRNNPPFQYAIVQQFDTGSFNTSYRQALADLLQQQPEDQFWSLFYRILDMVLQLNTWHTQLDDGTGLKGMLDTLVKSDFSKALYRLLAMANTFGDRPDEVAASIAILIKNKAWGLTMDNLMAQDVYLLKLADYPRRQRVKMLAQLEELFVIFFKGMQQVQAFALRDFETVLKGAQKHQPHLGLLYAFLLLFSQVKTQLNTLARQHLNFFYKEVLQLKLLPLIPDHVHLVSELARQLPDYLLAADTGLKAGKDALGKTVTFQVEKDVVLNKAKVNQLRTLFKDPQANLFAAPVANSADGQGEAFRNPAFNSWPVLGTGAYASKNNPLQTAVHFPFAATGLILSSPVLLLKEGTREVTLTLELEGLAAGNASLGLAAVLNSPWHRVNEGILADFEKAGIDKLTVAAIRKHLAGAGVKEKWFPENEFISLIGGNDTTALKPAFVIAYVALLQLSVTTEKGWYPLYKPQFTIAGNQLKVVCTLAADAPAIVPAPADVLQVTYPVTDPLLRITFNHQLHFETVLKEKGVYDILSQLVITQPAIQVAVKNVKQLLLSNEEGGLDANKKFLPFTAIPTVGSSFIIGSDEVFRKRLTDLKINVEWDGLPADFKQHYKLYDASVTNESFKATLQQLNNGKWVPFVPENNQSLFRWDGSNTLYNTQTWNLQPVAGNIARLLQSAPLAPYSNASLYGFLKLNLQKDFYHDEYAQVLAAQVLQIGSVNFLDGLKDKLGRSGNEGLRKAAEETVGRALVTNNWAWTVNKGSSDQQFDDLRTSASDTVGKTYSVRTNVNSLSDYVNGSLPDGGVLPPQPYTPTIKSVMIDYVAATTTGDITLLHKYPYEESNYKLLPAGERTTFMPVFTQEGNLYIGLQDAVPGTNINLLFQLSEFTANPDVPKATVTWDYLVGNEWHPLLNNSQILSDATQQLLVSGIVTLALPWEADKTHTILPAGYHWLRVSAAANTAAVCEAVDVVAQAAIAVFHNEDNDGNRVVPGLPPNTISGLVIPDAMINKISQPWPSFGGRRPEVEEDFYIRISERLRHKGRAINVFDYERIVLQAFPAIYKIKCIPHSKMCRDQTGKITWLLSPGWVTLAAIPRISDYPADEKFTPKVSRITLEKVAAYLQERTTVFANVQVINPEYQAINFSGNIRFTEGVDVVYYQARLIRAVQEYMSPWINSGSQDIVFGGTLMMSSVLQFIEQLSYVDFVTDFTMYVITDGVNGPPLKAITADTPWSVLIAGKQTYTPITACPGTRRQPVFKIKADNHSF